jgi:hypothetical protein
VGSLVSPAGAGTKPLRLAGLGGSGAAPLPFSDSAAAARCGGLGAATLLLAGAALGASASLGGRPDDPTGFDSDEGFERSQGGEEDGEGGGASYFRWALAGWLAGCHEERGLGRAACLVRNIVLF